MVQLKRDLPNPTKDAPDNTYWAVGDRLGVVQQKEQRFRKKKYVDRISEPVTARIVINRKNREERGFLNYENCTIAELETFVERRRLATPTEDTYHVHDLPSTIDLRPTHDRQLRRQTRGQKIEALRAKAKKAAYIKVLLDADDTAVFDRFFELPPEVRKIVYKKHYDDFPYLLLPHQPPLTLASKLLRAEALPSFFEQTTFALRFKVFTRAHRNSHHLVRPNRVSLCDTADDPDLLTSTNVPDSLLSRVSRLRLCLLHRHTHRPNSWGHRHVRVESMSFDIDLNDDTGPVLDREGGLDGLLDPYWDLCCERLEPVITRVLKDVAARPKAHRLRRDDIKALLGAVREALNPPVEG
jgi:hypothetical protein